MAKSLKQISKFAIPLVIGFFIGRAIYGNWGEVRDADWRLSPAYLAASFLLTLPWFCWRPFVWAVLLRRFGYRIPFRASFQITRRAELSRFVPGAIWHYVSRVHLASRWGVPLTACLAATLVEMVLLLLAALPVALWSLDDIVPLAGSYYRVVLVFFLAASVAIVHPAILNRWVGWLARLAGQPFRELQVHWFTLAAVWLSYLTVWILEGLGLAFFVRGVMDVGFEPFPRLASNYAAAWTVGILTMVAPAGMGVRDGALGLLLQGALPLGTALTLAVAIRLWLTLVELIWAAISHISAPPPAEPQDAAASTTTTAG